jgi:hypothetical protein
MKTVFKSFGYFIQHPVWPFHRTLVKPEISRYHSDNSHIVARFLCLNYYDLTKVEPCIGLKTGLH